MWRLALACRSVRVGHRAARSGAGLSRVPAQTCERAGRCAPSAGRCCCRGPTAVCEWSPCAAVCATACPIGTVPCRRHPTRRPRPLPPGPAAATSPTWWCATALHARTHARTHECMLIAQAGASSVVLVCSVQGHDRVSRRRTPPPHASPPRPPSCRGRTPCRCARRGHDQGATGCATWTARQGRGSGGPQGPAGATAGHACGLLLTRLSAQPALSDIVHG
jgi:hypothetical protein